MNIERITTLLHDIELFKGIPLKLLAQFSSRFEEVNFPAGTTMIHKGEEGDAMYVILDGKVVVHEGEHVVAFLEKGNFFGEFSLLDSMPRSMSVTALYDVDAISITREMFYDLIKNQPEIAPKIISTLTGRLRKQNEALLKQLKAREEELTRLVEIRTLELKHKTEEVVQKNKEITDNLNYAKRIQAAILPDINLVTKSFPQSFVLYIPKDIVSGDFYSFSPLKNKPIIAAADCTGHGVTGAFLSVIGSALINQIVNEKKINSPAHILKELNEEIISALHQRESDSHDGMDVAICAFDFEKQLLQFSGANRPLWLVRNNELLTFTPDKFPVGGMQLNNENEFTTHHIILLKEDTLYIFSDGYADQFGGESGKKLMTKKFKEMLLSVQHLSMKEQCDFLKNYFLNWKGSSDQVDDVLVIGIRI